jgi:hypothetical protein
MLIFLSTVSDIATSIQTFITGTAVIIAGIWTYWLFVKKRQKYPSAKIEHQISHRPITNSKMLLSVNAIVSNGSSVLLSLTEGRIEVNQMLPPKDELLDILNTKEGTQVTNWHLLSPLVNPIGQREYQLEPGESQQFLLHYVIDDDIQTILVYTYFRNVEIPRRSLGWTLTTIYDLRSTSSHEQKPEQVAGRTKGKRKD